MAGYLLARLPEAGLGQITDPRKGAVKWKLGQLLTAVVVGAMAGCRSLRDVEQLTALLSPALRKKLGIARRLADTTLRDALCAVSVDEVRAGLHRLVHAAWRRKALVPRGLPFGVMALDGKVTAVPAWDDRFVQKQQPQEGLPYGLVRTVTCTLVSAAGRPCVDAIPIPEHTNEMGHFEAVFESVKANFDALFGLVTYDAGALSEANGRQVVEAGKHYLFSLKGDQRTMFKLAEELLEPTEVAAKTVDVLSSRTTVTRQLVLLTVQQSWAYGEGKGSIETRDDVVTRREARLFVTSLETGALSPAQWLLLVRSHWGVESNHHTLDTAFAEDDHPWIVVDGNGLLVVLLLRRIAYTLLTLFRSVSQRSEARRDMRWRELLLWVWTTAVAATELHLADLRPRKSNDIWS
jgi:hypothetical protein